ncbi:hypothetical protein [Streptomyces violascens]|uniref:hypothetical protein n=1 Tax=Streptomyces violascens TaxID=67381 RepID=UPI0036A5F337
MLPAAASAGRRVITVESVPQSVQQALEPGQIVYPDAGPVHIAASGMDHQHASPCA